ncbi:hypothetical protein [Pseudomonas sp. 22 E 5]|nr:hypothetical protein [Pseudomonas sp. 22 E 5]
MRGDRLKVRVGAAGAGGETAVGIREADLRAIQFKADLRQLHLSASGFYRRRLASFDAAIGDHQAALGQGHRALRQVEAFLGSQGAVVAVDHIGAQAVATLLQRQRGGILSARCHIDTRTTLTTQLQRLAEFYRGGTRVAAGVFSIPGSHGIGDQTRLLAAAFGNIDFPLRGGKVGVVGEGGLQG